MISAARWAPTVAGKEHAGRGFGGHAQAHEWHLQPGIVGDQNHVAVQEDREADSDAEAVHCRDERLGESLQCRHQVFVARLGIFEDGRVGHLSEVLAGAERPTRAGEHDTMDIVVVSG